MAREQTAAKSQQKHHLQGAARYVLAGWHQFIETVIEVQLCLLEKEETIHTAVM